MLIYQGFDDNVFSEISFFSVNNRECLKLSQISSASISVKISKPNPPGWVWEKNILRNEHDILRDDFICRSSTALSTSYNNASRN